MELICTVVCLNQGLGRAGGAYERNRVVRHVNCAALGQVRARSYLAFHRIAVRCILLNISRSMCSTRTDLSDAQKKLIDLEAKLATATDEHAAVTQDYAAATARLEALAVVEVPCSANCCILPQRCILAVF